MPTTRPWPSSSFRTRRTRSSPVRNYEARFAKAPTYRKLVYQRFADWLKAKYATREALATAWGNALKPDESVEAANITPFPVWYQGKPSQRIADQMHFIYTTQRDYYTKFEAAVRKTGYKGQLIGSCWQAADWVGHLYNVLTDRQIGFIDRHNYNKANLQVPGAGLLERGLPVGARPAVHVFGMGRRRPCRRDARRAVGGHLRHGPARLGRLDAIRLGPSRHAAAQVDRRERHVQRLRRDRAVPGPGPAGPPRRRPRGAIVGNRRISLPALYATGDVGLIEQFSLLGGANNKSFDAAVPSAALAAGRVVLEFVDGPVEKPVIDTSAAYIDAKRKIVRSTTGQLAWDHSGRGFITVDTPGTKALIGHGGGAAGLPTPPRSTCWAR